jgi:hypothetical protein
VHVEHLVSDVVVLVVDDHVAVAVVLAGRQRIAFEERAGGDRHGDQIALVGPIVDDDLEFGLRAGDDVDGYADVGAVVDRSEIGMKGAVRADGVDQRRRVRRHRRGADLLIPGIIGGEELIAHEAGHIAALEFLHARPMSRDGAPTCAAQLSEQSGPGRAERAREEHACSPSATATKPRKGPGEL